MRRPVLLVALLAVTLLPAASAHGDAEAITWSGTLAPAESVAFERAIHWHRLVGTVDGGDAESLSLVVIGPNGTTEVVIGPGGVVNAMLRCCFDVVWTEHTFRITNHGEASVQVDARIALLHDDFAVVADGAEGGNGIAVLFFSGLVGSAAWRARPVSTPDADKASQWRRRSTLAIALAWGLLLVTSLVGMIAFGGGPLQGSLTAFAFLTLPGPIVGSHLLGKLVLFLLWTFALFAWSGARRWAPRPADTWLALAILIGGPLFTFFAALEYRLVPVVVAYGMVPPVVFLGVLWFGSRYRGRISDGGTPSSQ